MPTYWLAPFRFLDGAYRLPPGGMSVLDLRDQALNGLGFFALQDGAPAPAGGIQVGATLAGPVLNRASGEAALGLQAGDLAAPSLRDAIWNLLTVHADPTGAARWRPLVPTVEGNLELHLGGHGRVKSERFSLQHPHAAQVLAVHKAEWEFLRAQSLLPGSRVPRDQHQRWLSWLAEKYRVHPNAILARWGEPPNQARPHGTTVLDDFNRANSADSLGAAYTLVSGTLDIDNNEVDVDAAGGNAAGTARHDTTLAGADHYVQVKVKSTHSTVVTFGGVIGRKDNTATLTYYSGRLYWKYNSVNDDWRGVIYKTVAGVDTELAASGSDLNLSVNTYYLVKLNCSGSTITVLVAGVQEAQLTDTAIAAGTYGGIRGDQNSGQITSMDDLEEADLAAAATRSFAAVIS